MARIRKAIAAALGAGISAAIPLAHAASPDGYTPDEVGTIAGGFVAAAVSIGYATWFVRNATDRPGRHEAQETP